MAGNFKRTNEEKALIRNLRGQGIEYKVLTGVSWDLKVPEGYYQEAMARKTEEAMDNYYEKQEEEQYDIQDQIDSGLIEDADEYINENDEVGALYQGPFELTEELTKQFDAQIKEEYAQKNDLMSKVVLEFRNVGNLDEMKDDKELMIAKAEELYAGHILDYKECKNATVDDVLLYNTKKTIHDLVNGKNFKQYLSLYGNFLAYNATNTALVYWQCPNATIVKGAGAWKALDRHPKAGSSAIYINGFPKDPKVIEDKEAFDKYIESSKYYNDPINAKQKEKLIEEFEQNGKVEIYYQAKSIQVFDISQTEGKELESLKVSRLNKDFKDYEEIMDALTELVSEVQGTKVERKEMDLDSGYLFIGSTNTIHLNSALSEQDQIKYLSEGIADAFLHNGQPRLAGIRSNAPKERSLQKLESCCVAYLMMQKLGIETDYAFQEMLKPLADNQVSKLSVSKNKSDPIMQSFPSCLSRAKVCATAMEDKINEKIKEKNEVKEAENPEEEVER